MLMVSKNGLSSLWTPLSALPIYRLVASRMKTQPYIIVLDTQCENHILSVSETMKEGVSDVPKQKQNKKIPCLWPLNRIMRLVARHIEIDPY